MLFFKYRQKHNFHDAFSLVEVLISLVIIGILAAVYVGVFTGLSGDDKVDRIAQLIFNDLVNIRTKSLSYSKDYRINFVSDDSWTVEYYDDDTTSWVQEGETRLMDTETYLTSSSYANAGSNLQSTPRGLFEFQSGASGNPYVTVTRDGSNKVKSLYVAVGGSITIRSE
ncbi:MAG: type II secretion system protein [Bdellovibrionota bacterium]|nr:type II secretion system protein [Deltaproteobacteria bacterium]